MEWPHLNFASCNLLLTSNLVSHSLGLNDSNIIKDSLVEVEVLGQSDRRLAANNGYLLSVVLLDDGSGGSLHGLGSYSTHFGMLKK